MVDDVFIMVRRFEERGPPEGRKFKIKARDADLYDSQDWDTASDDGSMSIRSSEADATARLEIASRAESTLNLHFLQARIEQKQNLLGRAIIHCFPR